MNGQTQIKGDRISAAKDNVQCEWCDKPSSDSYQLMCRVKGKKGARSPSGMRVYFCEAHREKAQALVKEPIR